MRQTSRRLVKHTLEAILFPGCQLPIPKITNESAINSDNFRGIALSSVYVKLFDNIILVRYYDKLCSSDLQFGFHQNSFSHII